MSVFKQFNQAVDWEIVSWNCFDFFISKLFANSKFAFTAFASTTEINMQAYFKDFRIQCGAKSFV